MRIILASGSPRRRQLLEDAGFKFEVIESHVDEDAKGDCALRVEVLARRKAEAVREKAGDDGGIIAADTLVSIWGRVLEKPACPAEAFWMLTLLSGNKHTVFTGVAIVHSNRIISFVESTDVYFRNLTDAEINDYIDTGEPFDKAGAYGIQGRGAMLVSRIEGCFYAVMGLPLARLFTELRSIQHD